MKIKGWKQTKEDVFTMLGECDDCGRTHMPMASGKAKDIVRAICIGLEVLKDIDVKEVPRKHDRVSIQAQDAVKWDYSKFAILRVGDNGGVETDWLINCSKSECNKKMQAVPDEKMILFCHTRGALFNRNLRYLASKAAKAGKSKGLEQFLRAKLAPFVKK